MSFSTPWRFKEEIGISIDIEAKNKKSYASLGHVSTVNLLLNKGTYIQREGKDGCNPLIKVASQEKWVVVDLLL